MPPLVEARAAVDDEYRLDWLVYHRRVMEAAEIKNGRLAMLAITGFAFQEERQREREGGERTAEPRTGQPHMSSLT